MRLLCLSGSPDCRGNAMIRRHCSSVSGLPTNHQVGLRRRMLFVSSSGQTFSLGSWDQGISRMPSPHLFIHGCSGIVVDLFSISPSLLLYSHRMYVILLCRYHRNNSCQNPNLICYRALWISWCSKPWFQWGHSTVTALHGALSKLAAMKCC